MKLYLVTSPEHAFEDDVILAQKTSWQGTQADARKARIAFEEPFKEIKPLKRPKVTVEEIDVPTNKEGLLTFLNGMN